MRSKASTFATFGRSWRPTAGSAARWYAIVREANGNDLARIWRDNLRQAQEMSLVSEPSARRLADLFAEFERRYEQAIRGFAAAGRGLAGAGATS